VWEEVPLEDEPGVAW